MPDEEFDAHFRRGLANYPKQPEYPAAWHRMELLLDAEVRQHALRRKVLRLFGAEALLLLLALWTGLRWAPAAVGHLQGLTEEATLVQASPAAASVGQAKSSTPSTAATGQAAGKSPVFPFGVPSATSSATLEAAPEMAAGKLPNQLAAQQLVAQQATPLNSTIRPRRKTASPLLLAALGGERRTAGAGGPRPQPKQRFEGSATQAPRPASAVDNSGSPGALAVADGPGAREAAAPGAAPVDLLLTTGHFSGILFLPLPDSLQLAALVAAQPALPQPKPSPEPALVVYRLQIGAVAAPEFSTVRSNRLTTPGGDLGLQLDFRLGRRWHLNTGYLLTQKRYVAHGSDYHPPTGFTLPNHWVISDVAAVCRIIEIPLNVRYDLWQKLHYQVFASAGLSSLLMRREQYTYDYEPIGGQPVPPADWVLLNGSEHVLKILHLSAGYERALGQHLTAQAEPFVNLPLAGVGFGAVRLRSAGVFFSLKYGLLPMHAAAPPAAR